MLATCVSSHAHDKNQFSVRLTGDCTSSAATESRFGFVGKQSTEYGLCVFELRDTPQNTLRIIIQLIQSHCCKIISCKTRPLNCGAWCCYCTWEHCFGVRVPIVRFTSSLKAPEQKCDTLTLCPRNIIITTAWLMQLFHANGSFNGQWH